MLEERIRQELTAAVRAGDRMRSDVLRMLLSEGGYRRIDLGRELTDEEWVGVVSKEVKKRREAASSFRAGGREEQALTEEAELGILQAYLPKMLSEEEIRRELAGMELRGDFGQAMKAAAPVFKGRADGAVVARLVREIL